ncbi:MAG: V-type ATPase subunit [Deltaproteobacteria bacterium]|nr:MAG: V-type ATPase subunit [Deltaproteobacteria bacterium]
MDILQLKEDRRYAYGVSRVRALELKLLDRANLAQLAQAQSLDELLHLLGDFGYGHLSSGVSSGGEWDKLLQQEYRETIVLLEQLLEEPKLIRALRIRDDFHNLKVFLKARLSGRKTEVGFKINGLMELKDMGEAIEQQRFELLIPPLQTAARAALAAFSRFEQPQYLEMAIDKEMYRAILTELTGTKNMFLVKLVRTEIDLINIKAFLRLCWRRAELEEMRFALTENGYLDRDFFCSIYSPGEPLETLPPHFRYTDYADLIKHGVSYLISDNSFARLEKLADDHLGELLRRTKLVTLGVEPIVAYGLARKNELRLLNFLIVAKLNKLPQPVIEEGLPDVYL